MLPIRSISSRTAVLPVSDIDTDQIIPARFLTTTSREGLGEHLFADWRYRPDGSENPDFVLNQPSSTDCRILVAGRNFGCGSSREHAPWALRDYGIDVVISSEFADIFRSNSLKNGLLPLLVSQDLLDELLDKPGVELTVDIASSSMTLPDGRVINYPIDGFARHCLLEGIDQLGFLQQHEKAITDFEENRPWTP